ncbi:MAG: hypothetical protein RPU34_04295 [Candidatus Sedimenticola sp. (ex Thyasira tokunagai)]
MEPGGGKTVVKAAKVLFNANTGAHTIESKDPLKPLDVELVEPNRNIRLDGNSLTIQQEFASNEELTNLIQCVYYGLPPLLNVDFADPPIIERVDGEIGKTRFRWELAVCRTDFLTTTQEKQEKSFAGSWERIGLLSVPTNTRIFAALHFYYVAVRLQRQSTIAGEFLPEMILNLSKSLEVLFPPAGDGKTINAARRGLEALEFSGVEIEADYIPAMALRNEIDVAHVGLGLFSPEQLVLIHGYVQRAENAFRELFKRLLVKVENNQFTVEPYTRGSARPEAVRVVERLAKYSSRYPL